MPKVYRFWWVRSRYGIARHIVLTKTKNLVEGSKAECGRIVGKEWTILEPGQYPTRRCKDCEEER